jgi:hypothetical protein
MKRNPVNPYGRRSTDFRTRSVPFIKKAALMNEGLKALRESKKKRMSPLMRTKLGIHTAVKHGLPFATGALAGSATHSLFTQNPLAVAGAIGLGYLAGKNRQFRNSVSKEAQTAPFFVLRRLIGAPEPEVYTNWQDTR